jgi:hypothetical protein
MWKYLDSSLPNFFADDLACVIGGRMGVKYSLQCLDLEARLKKVFEYLEYYAILSVQPINFHKTELMWSARAVGGKPTFDIAMGQHKIAWVNCFKYLGYTVTCKLGWSKMIDIYKRKIRQRVAIVKSCRMFGTSSHQFRRVLFTTYVRPLFTWLFGIFPLLTECQKDDLGHFYLICLKRIVGISQWNDLLFTALYAERSLESLCTRYWIRYRKALNNTADGMLLYEQSIFNLHRNLWLAKKCVVKHIHRSKRLIPYVTTIEKALKWTESNVEDSTPVIPREELELLASFPESFL